MPPTLLPIDAVLPEVCAALAHSSALVLEAPPGAGKTTRVPRAILDSGLVAGEIVVLEPRRLAARLAARRVAEEMGERLGQTVGYTVRYEDVSSAKTRIRFVTEGVLTRRLTRDPLLHGIGAVVLDEFHERHVHGDVALALLERLRKTSRPDLRIVVMSATLDAAPVAAFLGCETLRSEGKRFDVTVEHLPSEDTRPLELQVASAVRSLLVRENACSMHESPGHVLVFLPGAREIRAALSACANLGRMYDLALFPLHGDLSPAEQDRAINTRGSAKRTLIFSTNLAESSVTIEGVSAVIDSGLVRVVRHAPWSGLPTSSIEKISRASAVQRAGRAGRTRAGHALRLYTKADFETRKAHDVPELLRVDLASTVLDLAGSGLRIVDVAWLDTPPEDAQKAAHELLFRLGALSPEGDVTAIGKRMLAFPMHPRQARLLVEAERRGVAHDGAVLAAILGERDLRAGAKTSFAASGAPGAAPGGYGRSRDIATEPSDLLGFLERFREAESSGFSASALRAADLDAGAVLAVERARQHVERKLRNDDSKTPSSLKNADEALLLSILAAFPDRVARRKREGSRALALSQGGSAELSETSAVRDAPWLVAVDAELVRGRMLVRLASAIDVTYLLELFESRIREVSEITFDDAKGAVVGTLKMLYDALTIDESMGVPPNDPRVTALLFEHVQRSHSAQEKIYNPALTRWVSRVRFAAAQDPSIRAPSDEAIERALRALCEGKTTLQEVESAHLLGVLQQSAGPLPTLDRLAPERITLASGRSATVMYEANKPPWIASYLQDFFGTKTTPHAGRVPVVLHLLAPNKRAVQITTDLEGFWSRHYPSVRKELMRKYPRQAWPEETHTAVPMKPPRPPRTR